MEFRKNTIHDLATQLPTISVTTAVMTILVLHVSDIGK